jgi:hypothetical protein
MTIDSGAFVPSGRMTATPEAVSTTAALACGPAAVGGSAWRGGTGTDSIGTRAKARRRADDRRSR